MWNKNGGEGFAAVCGGYTAHKVGLTNTFAGTKQLNKLYTYIPPDIDIFTNFKGYLEIKGYLELMEQASTKPQRAKILAADLSTRILAVLITFLDTALWGFRGSYLIFFLQT